MFKATPDVARKEGTRFRTTQRSQTIICRFLFLSLPSLSLTSPFLLSFCVSILPRCLSFSLSLFSPLAIFLLLPFRDATMCVVRRGSRQGRLANNTLQFFRSPAPLLPASSRPSRPLPTVMPSREKGKKVPNIQDPVRKSSSMNASTSPSALNHHPPCPLLNVARHLRSPSATSCMMKVSIFLSRACEMYVFKKLARNRWHSAKLFTISSLMIVNFN